MILSSHSIQRAHQPSYTCDPVQKAKTDDSKHISFLWKSIKYDSQLVIPLQTT